MQIPRTISVDRLVLRIALTSPMALGNENKGIPVRCRPAIAAVAQDRCRRRRDEDILGLRTLGDAEWSSWTGRRKGIDPSAIIVEPLNGMAFTACDQNVRLGPCSRQDGGSESAGQDDYGSRNISFEWSHDKASLSCALGVRMLGLGCSALLFLTMVETVERDCERRILRYGS